MDDVDPVGAGSRAEFLALLRRRREVAGLSYRQLARRARQGGGSLPPSTVATMLQRSTLPGRELVAEYVRACGADGAEVAAWLAARDRVAATGEPSAPVVPRQLPAPVGLLGRRAGLAALGEVVGGAGLVVVTGPPGVGKSALAVEWAHRAAGRFPDGQLHLASPATAGEALAHALVGLGVPGPAVPADERHAAALFRSVVADRRVLVVLDGVDSADRVRLLRPGGPGSAMVVTSRDRMVALSVHDGAHVLAVPPLDRADAVAVLARAAGERVVTAEPDAAARLADLCEGVPLVLRAAAVTLDRTVATPLADLVARMEITGPPAALGDPRLGLTAVFDTEHDRLDEVGRRVFRLCGTLPVICPSALAMATGVPLDRVRAVLGGLADRHLVTYEGGELYAMSNLLREYARARDDPARHTAA
ncbi:NB-ARC domain-containing protein [Actinosynnema sp. NPDC050436]|uniref:NB-ARC domain-containing protein n=1 Tax=Actinosynnema sp. NPDC050436 TaxID=3155659 RepID=UPI0033E8B2DB